MSPSVDCQHACYRSTGRRVLRGLLAAGLWRQWRQATHPRGTRDIRATPSGQVSPEPRQLGLRD